MKMKRSIYELKRDGREQNKKNKRIKKEHKRKIRDDAPKVCPFCGSPVVVSHSAQYYNGDNTHLLYVCTNSECKAYANASHKSTLADVATRRARQEAHYYFDQLYNEAQIFHSRTEAYIWLSKTLNIPSDKCHMKFFNEKTCKEVVKICKNKLNNVNKIGNIIQQR